MKWKEFKDFVEKNGITDNMIIENIDTDFSEYEEELTIDIYAKETKFEIYC